MNPILLRELESVTATLGEFALRLTEAFYEENQIYLAQQRILKLRAGIDRERQRINQFRTVLHRRKEQERMRKKSSNDEEN